MDINEYEEIKNLNYLQYCEYLQKKYGIGICDFMTENWNPKQKCKRTKEGLIAHHKYEDHAIMLSNREYAKKNPFEWQKAENIVYCDYLEHLFLHILIYENPAKDSNDGEVCGIGGVINFLIPELNDIYSGFEPKQIWKKNLYNKVKNDKNVYLVLVKRFKDYEFKVLSVLLDIKYRNIMNDIVSKKKEQAIIDYENKKIKEDDFEYILKKLDFLQKNIYENNIDSLDSFDLINKNKKNTLKKMQTIFIKKLTRSFNSQFGLWSDKENKSIYDEIKKI